MISGSVEACSSSPCWPASWLQAVNKNKLSSFILDLNDVRFYSDDKIDKYKHLPLSCFDMINVRWKFLCEANVEAGINVLNSVYQNNKHFKGFYLNCGEVCDDHLYLVLSSVPKITRVTFETIHMYSIFPHMNINTDSANLNCLKKICWKQNE